ncbi:hypothetical protein CEXT_255131 [Caerostris extrusa]|uniref:Uncharacterized protein n=1 Tax=Caerostris extrusa TaxID=172846 RepID=A0AAV4VFK1_CAEEX|nr:hypothetical protein CEXT_255131 [Caerostris extrusa]
MRHATDKLNSNKTILPRMRLSSHIVRIQPNDNFHIAKKGEFSQSISKFFLKTIPCRISNYQILFLTTCVAKSTSVPWQSWVHTFRPKTSSGPIHQHYSECPHLSTAPAKQKAEGARGLQLVFISAGQCP